MLAVTLEITGGGILQVIGGTALVVGALIAAPYVFFILFFPTPGKKGWFD